MSKTHKAIAASKIFGRVRSFVNRVTRLTRRSFDRTEGHCYTSPMKWFCGAVLMGFLSVSLSACVRTKAYQRETLAKPVMALDGDSDREGLRFHVLSTREGAVGGFGGGGGGCGCN